MNKKPISKIIALGKVKEFAMTEVYETEIKKIKDKVEIIDIQINAFKNKTS